MNFGIFSNGQRLDQPERSYDDDLREIVLADRLGYDEVWISEHTGQHWLPNAVPAPELLIAKAAALTHRIRFGAAVRRIALYPPQMMAIEGAVCDLLCEGRYNFGFGVGPPVTNYGQWGIDPADAEALTVEAIGLIRRCWYEPEPFDFAGRFWSGRSIDIYPKPRQTHIPVAVATARGVLLEMAAEQDFRLLTTWSHSDEKVAEIAANFDSACAKASRSPQRQNLTVARCIYVADTDAKAFADAEQGYLRMIAYNSIHLAPATQQLVADQARPADMFRKMIDGGNIIIGSPATVAARLRQFHETVGGFGDLLVVAGRDIVTPDRVDAMLALFMSSVAPRLRDLDGQVAPVRREGLRAQASV